MKHTVRTETTKRYTFTEAEFKKFLGIEGEGTLRVMAFLPNENATKRLVCTDASGAVRFELIAVQEGGEIETP